MSRSATKNLIFATVTFLSLGLRIHAQEQQFASLGDYKLEGGEVLRDCRIGYRTFGTLNSNKSNVVLFPTWALGTTEQLIDSIGSNKLVDSTRYFVIAVDALANGVSSSPSNSKSQPRMKFPQITIRDMVNTQHELLTKVLHLDHVHAVMGLSMGGMQTFQWIVSYPNFMDEAIPIVGSPQPTPYDLVFLRAQLRAIKNDPDWNEGNYTKNPARVAEAEFFALILSTPDEFNHRISREKLAAELEKAKAAPGFDSNDKIRQLEAIMSLDVPALFGNSMEGAAAVVKAKVLVVPSMLDRAVNPAPAIEFARLLHAQVFALNSNYGHIAPGPESAKLNPVVADFLAK